MPTVSLSRTSSGMFCLLSASELNRITSLCVVPGDGLYERAFSKLLIARKGQQSQLQLLGASNAKSNGLSPGASPLHLFVVTLRCEHSCPYCQVSRRSSDRDRDDMSEETGDAGSSCRAFSTARSIKIEFQGGEPLLNFRPYPERLWWKPSIVSIAAGKVVTFVITTNLALLTDDVLTFCRDHSILLSTSLDGPADLHNRNRPRPGGNSHALAEAGIRRAQEVLVPTGSEH